MVQDEYLIEVLVRNGYKLEDIKSDNFKVTKALKEEIILSKVTNLNDLSIFSEIVPTILISADDIKKQSHHDLIKILKRYVLKASSKNIKLDSIEFNSKLIVLDSFDLADTVYKCSRLSNIIFKNCSNLDLSTVYNAKVTVQDMEEFDLAGISTGIFELSCCNIKRIYLSKNANNSYMANFNNCTFDNTQGYIANIANGMEFVNVNFMTDDLMFKAAWIAWRNLKLSELPRALKVADAKYRIELHRMKDLDDTIENLFTEDNVSKIIFVNSVGYDGRKIKPVLELSKNPDLLENYEALEKILKNNKYIKTIMVTENLTAEQKEWLRLLAGDKEYIYLPWGREDYVSDTNSDIFPSIEGFIEADEILNEIVSGIDSSWGELEKFKYIYTKLGELISYDINITYKKDKENCNRANLITRDIFKSVLIGKGVCAGFAEIYQYVCRKAGLVCYTERDSNHEYNVIEYLDENGKSVKSYCDLTWDSERIKRREKCMYFGKSSETFKHHKKLLESDTVDVPEEKIDKIDKIISYERETIYKDILDKASQIQNIHDRAEYIIEEMMKAKSLKCMSNNEVVKFARYLLIRTNISKDNVGIVNGFAGKDDNKINDPRTILWLKDEAEGGEMIYYWTFNKSKQKFMNLSKDTLEDLILSGILEIYDDEKVPQIPDYKRKSNLEH